MWRLNAAECGTGSDFSHPAHCFTAREPEKRHTAHFMAYKLYVQPVCIVKAVHNLSRLTF